MNKEKDLLNHINNTKQILEGYHGATKLSNIPEFTSSQLFQNLNTININLSLDQTVTSALNQLSNILSAESIVLQFAKFQQEIKSNNIIPSSRLPENKRTELNAKWYTYWLLQTALSPKEYYFMINPSKFKKGDKKYNRNVFLNAIDTVVIDPSKVPTSSLETLGIVLDPDCQNLKEIFKQMRPLKYNSDETQKQSIRINEYDGRYVVFTPNKTAYKVEDPSKATKWEQRKKDVSVKMGIYPDIFSIIRREEYIIDGSNDKITDYQNIKKKLISSIKEIDWNKKEYSVRVMKNIQEIINEIDWATSAKILADKLYHLYKITWRHSSNDKKLLEASMRSFTQRIAQLMGISFYTQLHLLELNDQLEDQRLNLELFHSQIFLAITENNSWKFLMAFENYFNSKRWTLKQPFLRFGKEINEFYSKINSSPNTQETFEKALEAFSKQRDELEKYIDEHESKLEIL